MRAMRAPAKRRKLDLCKRETLYTLATLRYHDSNIITVLVGPEKAGFTIHRGPLCDTSTYFGPLFDGSFKESSEKVVAISEHTPETFDQFLGFAYSKNLDCTAFQAPGEDEKWIAYSRLYALA
jgi:hypothetical protein